MYSLHRCTCGRRGMIWVSRTKFIIKFPSIDRQSLFSDTAGSQARSFLKQLRRFLLFLFSSLDSWKSWSETKPRICRLAFHKSRKDEVAKSIDTDLSACFLLYTTAITKHRFSAFSINHKDLKSRKSYVKKHASISLINISRYKTSSLWRCHSKVFSHRSKNCESWMQKYLLIFYISILHQSHS